MTLVVFEDYEKLLDDDGSVICEGHKLDVEDVLFALGYRFDIVEKFEEDDE